MEVTYNVKSRPLQYYFEMDVVYILYIYIKENWYSVIVMRYFHSLPLQEFPLKVTGPYTKG